MTWITEKELEQEIINKGDEFPWKKNKHFITAVGKWRILSASTLKMSGSEKKNIANRNTCDIASIKRVTRRFHVVVVQNVSK